jgi:uncharacterized repeat protein (TIGR01451 family)
MRKFLLSAIYVSLTFFTSAQCDVIISLTQVNQNMCYGDEIVIMGFVNTNCPSPYTIDYLWQTTAMNSSQELYQPSWLDQSGSAPSITSIPSYTWFESDQLISACLTVSILDAELNEIGSGQTCIDNFMNPQPITIASAVVGNNCGQNACVVTTVLGGSAPYTFQYSDGAMGNSYYCFSTPGQYFVDVIDANGCVATSSVTIEDFEPVNASCESATTLTSGEVLSDTLCEFTFNTISCANGLTTYQNGWYVINSESSSHINIGATIGYYQNTPNNVMAIEVYEQAEGMSCSEAPLVYCSVNDLCFDLADEITIQPNTNYYIRILSAWTSLAPVQILAVLSDETIDGICGCTNASSCNYDPDAVINDSSCGYNGCMDAGACNYLSWATCDDGSCIFGSDLTGLIFHDVNGNGVRDTWPILEPSMGNVGFVHITELDVTIYADASGAFVLPDLIAGVYHVTYTDPNNAWILSVPSPLSITLPTCTGLLIPLVPANEAAVQVLGTTLSQNLHCTLGGSAGVWLQNTGNVPLNGTISITLDPSLQLSTVGTSVPFISNTDGVVVWEIDNQIPGTYLYYQVFITGPGAAQVGQNYPVSYDVAVADNNGNVFYENAWESNLLVTCAYDPNDKQAVPVGYADPHFILNDTEIEYKIRFQNTGNAPAFDVVIEDQLDLSTLDITTFQPLVASHSFSTIVDPDGRLRFVFNNIMLPDSGSDMIGSQGYVLFKIKPLPNLIPETVINNTANIYFDQNEAVVTNTTFHTIYSCDMIEPLSHVEEVCASLLFVYPMNDPYIETYSWYINETFATNENDFMFMSNVPGEYVIRLERTNPLCAVSHQFDLLNHPSPGTDITEDGWNLTAPDGTSWTWYLNEESIEGENSQTLNATSPGMYSVTTVNEFGCISNSEDVFLVGVEEKTNAVISLYPNPMDKEALLKLGQGNYEVTLINLVGEKIQTWSNAKNLLRIDRTSLSSGIYFVKVTNESGATESVRLVMK